MDATVETPVNEGWKDIKVRASANYRAIKDCEQTIVDKKFEGVDDVIDLAGRYFSYRMALEICIRDSHAMSINEKELGDIQLLVNTGLLHHKTPFDEWTEKTMGAISAAQNGRYDELIHSIKETEETLKEVPFIKDENVQTKKEELADGLASMADVLPVHGSFHFKLPVSAQLDDRYNGELDKYVDEPLQKKLKDE